MSIFVFFTVISASLGQAWWNFYLKKITIDKSAFLLMSWLFFGVVTTPLSILFLDKPFSLTWLPFILCTGFAQGIYLVLLCWAYTVADISLVFPIARGASTGFTTVVLTLMGAYTLSKTGIMGVSSVVLGAVCLGSFEFNNPKARVGILLALLLALIVTSYTVIDSFGAQEIPLPFYVCVMNITAPLVALPFLWKGRREAIVESWKKYKWSGFAVSLAGSGAYLIVMWAYQKVPAPYILALREISIVFVALLGFRFLNEPMYPRKILGISLILAGIFLIKMA
jgi:drug/metabolite transporter (DMT)-like permease